MKFLTASHIIGGLFSLRIQSQIAVFLRLKYSEEPAKINVQVDDLT